MENQNNISIRDYIKENFKNDSKEELEETINDSLKDKIDETLPGLGVFLEIIWENSDKKIKDELLEILKTHLN